MDKIEIKKPIIKSPKSVNNLSKSLKSKLKSKSNSNNNSSINIQTNFKKIKLTPKSSSKKVQSKLFIPTELSIVKPVEDKKPLEVKPVEKKPLEVKSNVKNYIEEKSVEVKPNVDSSKKFKKINKRRLSRRKKSTNNKVVSVDLNNNNNNKNKEKDIIEIINKFEKMDVKKIKTFLKNKGIDTKNNNKSKLMPYLYLLTCVDDDINIIKS